MCFVLLLPRAEEEEAAGSDDAVAFFFLMTMLEVDATGRVRAVEGPAVVGCAAATLAGMPSLC